VEAVENSLDCMQPADTISLAGCLNSLQEQFASFVINKFHFFLQLTYSVLLATAKEILVFFGVKLLAFLLFYSTPAAKINNVT
jgi:hypothetical protein